MPASRRARAMILAPRSCPSRPGLATTTRIFLSVTEATGVSRHPAARGGLYVQGALGADDQGVALAAARADRRHAQTAAAPAQLVDEGAEDSCPRGPDRVAERDRAAVDVDALLVDPQDPDRAERHRRKRLVDLPDVDIRGLDSG